jgi:hypothetical protein
MCRSIHTLRSVDTAVTEEEIRAAALQFVRKVSGYTRPSHANEAAFNAAVDEVASATARLLSSLQPSRQSGPPAAHDHHHGGRSSAHVES